MIEEVVIVISVKVGRARKDFINYEWLRADMSL